MKLPPAGPAWPPMRGEHRSAAQTEGDHGHRLQRAIRSCLLLTPPQGHASPLAALLRGPAQLLALPLHARSAPDWCRRRADRRRGPSVRVIRKRQAPAAPRVAKPPTTVPSWKATAPRKKCVPLTP